MSLHSAQFTLEFYFMNWLPTLKCPLAKVTRPRTFQYIYCFSAAKRKKRGKVYYIHISIFASFVLMTIRLTLLLKPFGNIKSVNIVSVSLWNECTMLSEYQYAQSRVNLIPDIRFAWLYWRLKNTYHSISRCHPFPPVPNRSSCITFFFVRLALAELAFE